MITIVNIIITVVITVLILILISIILVSVYSTADVTDANAATVMLLDCRRGNS